MYIFSDKIKDLPLYQKYLYIDQQNYHRSDVQHYVSNK